MSLCLSVISRVVLPLLSHKFFLARERFFKGYELLRTSRKISEVLKRYNNEVFLEPPFPQVSLESGHRFARGKAFDLGGNLEEALVPYSKCLSLALFHDE